MIFFNKRNNEIDELKSKVQTLETTNRTLKTKINELEKGQEDMKRILSILGTNDSDKSYKPKTLIKTKKTLIKGMPISKTANYESFKIPRYYDEKQDCFYSYGGNGAKRKLGLSFSELLELIKNYRKGFSAIVIQKKCKSLSKFSAQSLQRYIYIYRAGGFNNAIQKYAPKKGFDPVKLVSREVNV